MLAAQTRLARVPAALAGTGLALLFASLLAGCGSGGGSVSVASTLPPFSSDEVALYPVVTGGGAAGYIDRRGAMAIPARLAEAAPFSEGLAAVRPASSGPWGYIDQTGRLIIEPQFAEAGEFSQGLAAVRVDDNGSWGFADASGNLLIPPQFAAVGPFSEGLARVRSDQESGYVDTSGEWIIRMSEREAVGEFSGGLALVYERATDLYGFVDVEGTMIIAPSYADAWGFSEDLAAVRLPGDDFFGYIDRRGEWVIQPQFADARSFSEGLAAVQSASDSTWGYVDVTGSPVISGRWYAAEEFREGLARVSVVVGDTEEGYLLYGYAYVSTDGTIVWRDTAYAQYDAGITPTTATDPPFPTSVP